MDKNSVIKVAVETQTVCSYSLQSLTASSYLWKRKGWHLMKVDRLEHWLVLVNIYFSIFKWNSYILEQLVLLQWSYTIEDQWLLFLLLLFKHKILYPDGDLVLKDSKIAKINPGLSDYSKTPDKVNTNATIVIKS